MSPPLQRTQSHSGHSRHRSHEPHGLRDALHFLSRFATRPGSIGSIWPSSRELGEAMVESVPLRAGDVVVEYGPGTGSFTSVLMERMPGGVEYLGIERDPEFHRNLVRRFPGMRFHHGSAEDAPAILAHHNLGHAKLVLSGLPFANMPHELQGRILGATRAALHAEGVFRAFTYLFASVSPRTARFKQLAREHFRDHCGGRTVMRNFPPAKVLSYARPVKAS